MNINHMKFHQLNVHLHCCVDFLPMRLVRVRWGWFFNELFNPLGVHFGYGVTSVEQFLPSPLIFGKLWSLLIIYRILLFVPEMPSLVS